MDPRLLRLSAIGLVLWVILWGFSIAYRGESPPFFGAAALLVGLSFLPLGALLFRDVQGLGSDWARRTLGGSTLDAAGLRRKARADGLVFGFVAVLWITLGTAILIPGFGA